MDVFVSYSSKDEALAQDLCGMLTRGGFQHWIATDHAAHGKSYASAIIEAIDQAPVMVLVLSQASAESPHVLNEVNYAFNHGKTILPVVVGQLTLPKELEYYLGAQNLLPYAPTEEFEQEFMAIVADAVGSGPREERPTIVTGAEYAPKTDAEEAPEQDAEVEAEDDTAEEPQEKRGTLALILLMWLLAAAGIVVMVLLILSPRGQDKSADKTPASTTTTTTTTTMEEASTTGGITPTNPTYTNTTRPTAPSTTATTAPTSATTTSTTASTTATTATTTQSTEDSQPTDTTTSTTASTTETTTDASTEATTDVTQSTDPTASEDIPDAGE